MMRARWPAALMIGLDAPPRTLRTRESITDFRQGMHLTSPIVKSFFPKSILNHLRGCA